MSEPIQDPPPPKYRWPWFVAAGVLLGFALSVLWVWLAVKKIERERDVNGPLPAQK